MSAACQYATDVADAPWELLHPLLPKCPWTPGGRMDKNFKRTFATTAWTTQSEGTVARWCVPRVSSVS